MSDSEKRKLVSEIRENFGLNIRENKILLKFEYLKRTFILFFGVLFIIMAHFFIDANYYLINSLFNIFGWVFVWEFVYSMVFFNIKTRFQNKRFLKIVNAKIHFKEIE